jgi:hypothetical protein
MTIVKIILVGAVIAAVMTLAKTQMWFERAGIVSSCTEVRAPLNQRDGGQWWSCSKGTVTGYPSLTRDSCTSRGFVGGRELWMCPTPLAEAPF